MNIGDRVVFINADFPWCGDQFTVTQTGYGDAVGVLSDIGAEHYFLKSNLKLLAEDPANKQASGMCSATTIDLIKTFNVGDIISFTMNHKNLEISFEDGKIVMRDWDVRLSEPMDYRCDTIEQLEELMGAWENLCKFKAGG